MTQSSRMFESSGMFSLLSPSTEELTALVAAAKQHNINFIYAISPGLDMTFSSSRDTSSLKRKLDQVPPTQLSKEHTDSNPRVRVD